MTELCLIKKTFYQKYLLTQWGGLGCNHRCASGLFTVISSYSKSANWRHFSWWTVLSFFAWCFPFPPIKKFLLTLSLSLFVSYPSNPSFISVFVVFLACVNICWKEMRLTEENAAFSVMQNGWRLRLHGSKKQSWLINLW